MFAFPSLFILYMGWGGEIKESLTAMAEAANPARSLGSLRAFQKQRIVAQYHNGGNKNPRRKLKGMTDTKARLGNSKQDIQQGYTFPQTFVHDKVLRYLRKPSYAAAKTWERFVIIPLRILYISEKCILAPCMVRSIFPLTWVHTRT